MKNIYIFQISAVCKGVCACNDATPLVLCCTAFRYIDNVLLPLSVV